MSAVTQHHFAAQAELNEALARFIAGKLAAAIELRGVASLVVSGGTTGKGLFERLSHQHLPWSRVCVTLADERWVPPSDPHSNEGSIQRHLLQNAAASAGFVPLFDGTQTPAAAVPAVTKLLDSMARPFDVVVLGMGTDGHTASLFPGAEQGLDGTDQTWPCVAVPAPSEPNVPVPRMSLTAAALTDCRHLVLHITGSVKQAILQQALQPGPVAAMPVRLALQQQHVPCHVYWAP